MMGWSHHRDTMLEFGLLLSAEVWTELLCAESSAVLPVSTLCVYSMGLVAGKHFYLVDIFNIIEVYD